ncbi:MAG: class I SAM-dependent methyltransferase [Alphaproteobacteria bacterium]|nr:class I SAM-dependent methyltransferase [Alphaproteobacteria bacterium]
MRAYSSDVFEKRHANTLHSARSILSLLLDRIGPIRSAVDVGCGVGTWLSVLREAGVADIQGVDGPWVDQNLLTIPRESFLQLDLGSSLVRLPRRFDLALSLEVAEHLPAERADEFVCSLARLSDCVLFSAAIPFQGGLSHVNEQWQHYWVGKFDALDYDVYDLIRPRIWRDPRIPFWYKQNTLLFARRASARHDALAAAGPRADAMAVDLVHPEPASTG